MPRFKGHETFFFREGWISKAMFDIYANQNNELFSGNNGIVKLGVGSNMVKSIKYWMTTSNLLQYKNKKYSLTDELGIPLASNDVYLEDIFSLWLIHINVVRNEGNATTWNYFFNTFHGETFTEEEVKEVLKNNLKQDNIKYSDSSLNSDISVLLNMYSKKNTNEDPEENYTCPLSRLGMIKWKGNSYIRVIPDLNNISPLLILYAILLLIEDNGVTKEKYISISDLETKRNSLTNLFNLNRIIINEYLEQLSASGLIRIEKTAGLDMVYITCDYSKEDLIRLHFEREANL